MSKKFSMKRCKELVESMEEAVIYGRPGDPAVCECITCNRPFVQKIPWSGAILVRDGDCYDCGAAFQKAFESTHSLKLAAGDGRIH